MSRVSVPNYRVSWTAISMFWFFGIKIGVGLIVTIASANWLPPSQFAFFTQLLLFTAWLNLVATGGTVNGLVRQASFHRDDPLASRRVVSAALLIWAAITAIMLLLGLVFRGPISIFLVGARSAADYVPLLVALSAVAGVNQLFCAILTARRRVSESLLSQTAGFLASGAGAAWFLLEGDPAGAVVAFAAGPALTLLVTIALVRRDIALSGVRGLASEIRILLAHSAAFFAVATLPPFFLFAGRSVYQEHFSLAALALWLLANRISDLNSQMVGLYNTQIILPALSAAKDFGTRMEIVKRSLVVVIGLSLAVFVVFLAIGEIVLRLFLPASYSASLFFIGGYLLGDIFRSIVATGMIWALSRNRLLVYSAIEIGVIALITGAVVMFAWRGVAAGPAISYPAGYAIGALIIGCAAWRKMRQRSLSQSNGLAVD